MLSARGAGGTLEGGISFIYSLSFPFFHRIFEGRGCMPLQSQHWRRWFLLPDLGAGGSGSVWSWELFPLPNPGSEIFLLLIPFPPRVNNLWLSSLSLILLFKLDPIRMPFVIFFISFHSFWMFLLIHMLMGSWSVSSTLVITSSFRFVYLKAHWTSLVGCGLPWWLRQ